MLVLTRKCGETVEIAGGITVHVTEILPGRVKLGIEAPKETSIRRGELPPKGEVQAAPYDATLTFDGRRLDS